MTDGRVSHALRCRETAARRRAQRMKPAEVKAWRVFNKPSINAQYVRFHEGRRVLGLPLSRTDGDVSAGALI